MSGQRAVAERAVPLEPDAESSDAGTRRRAKSVPAALPLVPVTPPSGNAESPADVARDWVQKHAGRVLSGDSLLRLDRPSVGTTWAEHRKAAAQWEAAIARYPRLLYGLAHTGVTALVYVLLWATATPPGLVITAALMAAFAYWS